MDWTKVQRGLQFARKQGLLLMTVWHPLSLLETYAAKDVAPVLIESGGLTGNYQERLRRTGQRVAGLVAWRDSPEGFLQHNYRQAHELGLMHAAIARSVQPEKLGWVASERRVMNQQAYALVLYTFSQTPALVMEARKMPAASAPELDDWYHLWAVLGYAMGVEEKLLGRNAAEARTIGLAVRKAQFPAPGEPAAPGAARLLREELLYLAANRAKAPGTNEEAARAGAVESLAAILPLSPGLPEALGLQGDLRSALWRISEWNR
jgi:hypothetical protein